MSSPVPYGAPVDFTPASIAGGSAGLDAIFAAQLDQQYLVDQSDAARNALERAYDLRSSAIKAATGEDLGNPLVPQWTAEDAAAADRAAAAPGLADPDAATRARDAVIARQRSAYDDRLRELAGRYPQYAGIIRPDDTIEADAAGLARAADERLGRLLASNPGWPAAVTAFGAGMAGSFRDPIVLGSLLAGGGPGAARTVMGRILATAAREAFVNGATTAAMQPSVQAWRREAGLPNGFDAAALNVLEAAALGGVVGAGGRGLAEVAGVLGRARPALAADARGALDAATLEEATAAQAPAQVAPQRFDGATAAADRAAQAVEPVPLVAPDNIEAEVAQIVDSLAPHPDSVSGPKFESTDEEELARRVSTLIAPPRASQRVPTPILDHIRRLGGVDPAAPVAAELRGAGVTSPSLFRKGGLRALDNLPHDELPAEVRHAIADDGNGYADQNALIAAAGEEASGHRPAVEALDAERAALEARGVDFSAPKAEIAAKLAGLDAIDRRYRAADAVDGLSTDEVVSVPAGFTRRAHTEQLVRRVLALQPGLGADRVREAVNLSLFESTPIEQAVSDMLSDAAGVPREEAAIAAAYDQVHANPSGPVDEPLARISPASIEGTLVERGAWRDINDVELKAGAGYGLVKIIWRHGEESGKPFHLQVHKADVVALPRIVRDFVPAVSGPTRDWRVMREGRLVHYADKAFNGDRHVVTIYVEEPDARGAGRPLSARRASQPVPPRFSSAAGDTADRLAGTTGAAERPEGSIDPHELPGNPSELAPEAAGDAGSAETPRLDLDAERAAFEELGFGSDFKLPIGDELTSLDDLAARLEESRREIAIVEACRE